jgi:hypothetical protein
MAPAHGSLDMLYGQASFKVKNTEIFKNKYRIIEIFRLGQRILTISGWEVASLLTAMVVLIAKQP